MHSDFSLHINKYPRQNLKHLRFMLIVLSVKTFRSALLGIIEMRSRVQEEPECGNINYIRDVPTSVKGCTENTIKIAPNV